MTAKQFSRHSRLLALIRIKKIVKYTRTNTYSEMNGNKRTLEVLQKVIKHEFETE